jgi:hypothetical protein
MAMRQIWLVAWIASVLAGLPSIAAAAPSRWEQPANALAEQIAGILGPSQAQLSIRNLSTIAAAEIAPIRRLLEQDLKGRGVAVSGIESANTIRITLSESARARVWVAEIVQGNETRVAMVELPLEAPRAAAVEQRILLRKEKYLGGAEFSQPGEPVLAAIETSGGLVVLEREEISFFAQTPGGWKQQKSVPIGQRLPLTRDAHGILRATAGGEFSASVPGMECSGTYSPAMENGGRMGEWAVRCGPSDDPWTIEQTASGSAGGSELKAFYNAARNYFTGVVTPSVGVDLPPFYSAGLIPRAGGGVALLLTGIDGKVQLVDNGALRTVTGTRDWGSDFAVMRSECGSGTQVIASGSGEAASDSLRAYELPAQEAVAVSGAAAMDGTVTALWTAPDAKSVFAVVRSATNEYEVDRVTALCN